ncbi:putative endonuclease [Raineyella antarctica]|uniref:UPF0102 protein GA0111570_10888 n=1 Tax=Raineyella antarctica TaxID=1577474 RepID=A0A1G6HBG1_9ACTN|nr:YraN family protein [Raineyella antarctica]SDB91600.1 putative endonuclease [Raineyella antarctica]
MDAQQEQERRVVAGWGEDLAAQTLEADGMVVVARNWRCRAGEVDIIALEDDPDDGTVLVVCEVKTRVGYDFGDPLEAITPQKMSRMRTVTTAYLAEGRVRAARVRFDAVGIVVSGDRPPVLTHVRGIA